MYNLPQHMRESEHDTLEPRPCEVRLDEDWPNALRLATSSWVMRFYFFCWIIFPGALLWKMYEANSTGTHYDSVPAWIGLLLLGAITLPFAIFDIVVASRIARNGIVIPGSVTRVIASGRATRIEASYLYDGQWHHTKTGTDEQPPKDSIVLIAIDPKKPSRHRLIPYDFRLRPERVDDLKRQLNDCRL